MSKHEYAEGPSALRAVQKDLAYRLGLWARRSDQGGMHRRDAGRVYPTGTFYWSEQYEAWFRRASDGTAHRVVL
ncbi:hypothetical protein [Mycolicibacterium houstonense]|uniref:hypothetical protein n=1 Tax=Mycolicibacterium houstonense TaxID=146021 RepID=UPI000833B5DE|nr:hypothetical protein [Mycolicibacterium houstonense]